MAEERTVQLKLLRNFVAVAEHGSIVRAAKALRIAQPALSRQMRQLEDAIDGPIIRRDRRGVTLTETGVVLLDTSRTLLAHIERAVTEAMEARDGVRGQVRIAIGRVALEDPRVFEAIGAARKKYPRIGLDVRDVPSTAYAAALRGYDVDIGIGAADLDGAALRAYHLYDDVLDAVLVAATHRLADRPRVALADLAGERYLAHDATGQMHHGVLDALRLAGVSWIDRHDSLAGIHTLVAAGLGWTMFPGSRRQHPPMGTTAVPLTDFRFKLPIHLAVRARAYSVATSNVAKALGAAFGVVVDHRLPLTTRKTPASGHHAARVPSPELQHFVAFAAALDEQSLSRAAERLNLTQSGLSRRVAALERELGFPLLHRVAHGVVGTPAGIVLRGHLDEIVRLADDALATARRKRAGWTGSCIIGALPPELTGTLLTDALATVRERLPDVAIDIKEMSSEQQVRALRRHVIDVALVGAVPGLFVDATIASVTLVDDALDSVLVADTHPFAARSWLTAGDLASAPFVFLRREFAPRFHAAVMRGFAAIDLAPAPHDTFVGARTLWRAVAAGLGWTIGSRAQRAHPPAGTVGIPVEGLKVPWGLTLLWRRNETSVHVRQLLDVLRETGRVQPAAAPARVRRAGPAHAVTVLAMLAMLGISFARAAV